MSGVIPDPTYYADFQGLEALKGASKTQSPKATREVAQQFESLFINMLLKTMRQANLGDGLGDSDETKSYTEMFDQQLAVQMSQGKGLGLADMLVKQLTRRGAGPAAGPAPADHRHPGAATGAAAADPAAAATATAAGAPATHVSFVRSIAPYATQAAARLGVSSDTLIAHAALETGWGQHMPVDAAGRPSFNLFGIKASAAWSGATVNATTAEHVRGGTVRLPQSFRAYDSIGRSIDDYSALLRGSPRYKAALGTGDDVTAFAAALQRGGYATDPDYAHKLVATAQSVRAIRAAAAAPNMLAALPPGGHAEPV